MPRIVLCKTPTPIGEGVDAYRSSFESAGFEVQYIPVLQEEFRLDELTTVLQEEGERWAGVIITSKRGAEAWVQAVEGRHEVAVGERKHADWSKIQLFTVGSSSLDHISAHASTTPPDFKLNCRSAIQAKSANELVPHILDNPFNANDRILIIRGDKSTEELQRGLSAASRAYTELTVYTTSARPTLGRDVGSLLASLDTNKESIWLAFFSPSSAEMVLGSMDASMGGVDGQDGQQDMGQGAQEEIWSRIKVAAIGETTAKYLAGRKVKVDAVAREPTAQGLLDAIQAYDGEPTART